MAILYYDTETTGTYDFKLPPEHESQPDMVQLGLLLQDDCREIAKVSMLVVPGKDVSPGAEAVHGISSAYAKQFGVHPLVALWTFHALALRADTLVAYNNQFDDGILRRAYSQFTSMNYTDVDKITHRCCMKAATPLCKLPGGRNGQYKWPKLEEAYKILVDPAGFDGAHDALADVMATAAVWEKIVGMGAAQ